jgi:hypothetical protein
LERVELQGVVTAHAGSCPALTFTVQGFAVYTSRETEFRKGPCKEVTNGAVVTVSGRRMSDGRVRGDTVELRSIPGERVDIEGRVESLAGACPTVTFRVRGFTVYTSAATKFSDGRCQDVKNGRSVEVKGRTQADGRVLAEEVEIDD